MNRVINFIIFQTYYYVRYQKAISLFEGKAFPRSLKGFVWREILLQQKTCLLCSMEDEGGRYDDV